VVRACEAVDFEAGLAMQAYLRSGVEDARRVVEWAKRTGRVLTVRLVKGAYWDYETIHAEQMGWPCPVWPEKWMTDACFERMAEVFLDAMPDRAGRGGRQARARVAQRPLDRRDARGRESSGLPREAIELQMLHGMADQLKHAAAEMGLRIREYVPVGEMIPGMAYLVRRLLENTSNESWLKASVLDEKDAGTLLAAPAPKGTARQRRREKPPDAATVAASGTRSRRAPAVGDGKAVRQRAAAQLRGPGPARRVRRGGRGVVAVPRPTGAMTRWTRRR
jgi:RHH-type proline utilization regulon transcriptional repressor/proline dehydrogenase/delta 1-pyrroline-5-carboxylate dehydrogenase